MGKYQQNCEALAVAMAANIPIILWGAPGIGKTAVIEQIARHHDWHLETVIASICDPTDFKGMPRDDGGRTVFGAPDWAHEINAAGGGVVFLDEISTAPPSVQAALLRPVLGRVVGDLALLPDVRFVAAANPAGIAADGWELSAPLANRFAHLEWSLPAGEVSQGFMFGWEDIQVPVPDEDVVASARESARRSIGAFLSVRADLAHALPDASANAGRAWPSPRSWDMGATLLAWAQACDVHASTRAVLLAAAVGDSAAREFLAWERNLDLPDIEQALTSGTIELPGTPDRIVAVCASLVAAVKGDPTRKRCEAAVNSLLMEVCKSGHVDLATVALRRMSVEVRQSKAVLKPDTVTQFAEILRMMQKLPA